MVVNLLAMKAMKSVLQYRQSSDDYNAHREDSYT